MPEETTTSDATVISEATETVAEPPTSEEPKTQETKPSHDFEADAKKWKAIALKHEATAKANADAAQKLKDMELAGKSETEKLQAKVEEAESNARTSRIQALKLRVAAEKQLDPRLAEFLPDLDDEVDMFAAAEKLQEASGLVEETTPSRQPKSNLTNPLKDDDADGSQRERLIAAMTGKSPLS